MTERGPRRLRRVLGMALAALGGPLCLPVLAQSAEEVARRLYGRAQPDHGSQTRSCMAVLGLVVVAVLAYYLHRIQSTRRQREVRETFREVSDHIDGVEHLPDLFRAGQRVEVEHETERGRRLYGSYVQEVGRDSLLLGAPRHDGLLVTVHPGETVGVIVRHGTDSFRMEGEVLERKGGAIPSIRVGRSDWATRFQRRDYYRIELHMECRFELYRRGMAPPSEVHREGTIVNLSASGCRIAAAGPVSKARYCAVEFRIPSAKKTLFVTGRVIASQQTRRTAFHNATIACQFSDLKEADRELLVAFVRDVEVRRIRARREREAEEADRTRSR